MATDSGLPSAASGTPRGSPRGAGGARVHGRVAGAARLQVAGAIRRRLDLERGAEPLVQHARAQSRLDLVPSQVGGDNRGQLGVVAEVKELVQLLLRPRRARVRP